MSQSQEACCLIPLYFVHVLFQSQRSKTEAHILTSKLKRSQARTNYVQFNKARENWNRCSLTN